MSMRMYESESVRIYECMCGRKSVCVCVVKGNLTFETTSDRLLQTFN